MPTIALVDDDRNILTSVSIALEAEGYRIMTYTDGASALDGFRSSQPDLHPRHQDAADGRHETLRRLRQKSDLPVIFLTSKDEEIDGIVRPQNGRRRFHPQSRSRNVSSSNASSRAAPLAAEDPTAVPKENDAKALDRGLLRMDPERHTAPGRTSR